MIDFQNIAENRIELNEFQIKWRFTDPLYNQLPAEHLEQLTPLNKEASNFLWNYISESGLHQHEPFGNEFFKTVNSTRIYEGNEQEIKKWLYQRGLPFSKQVYLSWQPETAMITTWKLVVKYFDDFFYGGSDDLTVIDESLNWAVLFHHEDEIYFGTNKKYELSESEQLELGKTSM
jgi:hypothetical protein